MNEVVREFLLETDENLAQLDLDLVSLERNPREKETIARVFRTLHTVKGAAGFLGLVKLQAVSHAAENLLSKVRADEIAFGPAIATALLSVVDAIREILRAIETTESEGERDDSALIAQLEALVRGETAAPRAPAPTPVDSASTADFVVATPLDVADTVTLTGEPPPPATGAENLAATIFLPPGGLASPAARLDVPVSSQAQPAAIPPVEEKAPKRKRKAKAAPPPAPPATPSPAPTPAPTSFFVAPPEQAPSPPSAEPVEFRGAVAESAIRVDVGLLDKLMNAVGELVLARNQILKHAAASEDAVLVGAVQRLNHLATELQAGVMKTRMQPVGAVWGKYPRLVRDLAVACGKQVRFEMEGHDTELDKTVLEAIRDPLTHMVRNAVDHGLEAPAARTAAGKPPEGHLRLQAFHEGGKVVIEVADDGAGIDPRRVLDKAIRQGLLAPAAAEKLSEREVLELIFKPGFSTAEKVTQFSGRGVGMDVVRTNVEKIGGMVELESKLGRGAAFRMKIPLTLAIIPALVVGARGERFAIPQASLLELVRLGAANGGQEVERAHGAPVYRLRGNLLPLAFLDRELGLAPAREGATTEDLFIVVLQVEDRSFGLVVDAVFDTEEIVVKPLQQQLKILDAYAGATIMGDGRVALILDVLGLARRAGLAVGRSGVARAPASSVLTAAEIAAAVVRRTLIFAPRAGGRMAMSLEQVARLEEFPRAAVERLGDRLVVQYRGSIMPLVDVGELLDDGRPAELADAEESLQVVVHELAGGRIGLVVGRILDVADEAIAARAPPNRAGVLFNGVIRGVATEFLDLDAALRRAERLLRPASEGVMA